MRRSSLLRILIVLTAIAFAGCTMNTTTTKESGSSLNRIAERGELVVGTSGNMPPLNMVTKDGSLIGLEIDIARSMANAMGVELRVVNMPFSELLTALQSHEVDLVMSGMTITPQRNMKVAFAGPYMESGKCFLTKQETIARAADAKSIDAANVKLAALKGSTSATFVREVMPKTQLVEAVDYDDGVSMVIDDKVHAMVADYEICIVSLARHPDAGLLSVITLLTYEPIGAALSPDDPLFLNWVQNYLNTLEGSGNLEALKAKWTEDASWLKRLP